MNLPKILGARETKLNVNWSKKQLKQYLKKVKANDRLRARLNRIQLTKDFEEVIKSN